MGFWLWCSIRFQTNDLYHADSLMIMRGCIQQVNRCAARLGTRTHMYAHSHSFHIQICVISRQMAWHQSSASTRICMCASHDTKSRALNKHSDCYAINSVCDFVILLSCLEFDLFLYLFSFITFPTLSCIQLSLFLKGIVHLKLKSLSMYSPSWLSKL